MSGRRAFSVWILVMLLAASVPVISAVQFVHKPTGVRFPTDSGAVSIENVRSLAPDDRDVAVTYKSSGAACCLTITVFMYAKLPPLSRPDETLESHATEVRKGITSKYPAARCTVWKPKGAESDRKTSREVCSFEADLGGKEQPAVSFTTIRNVDRFWLKYRATANVSDRVALERALLSLEKDIR